MISGKVNKTKMITQNRALAHLGPLIEALLQGIKRRFGQLFDDQERQLAVALLLQF